MADGRTIGGQSDVLTAPGVSPPAPGQGAAPGVDRRTRALPLGGIRVAVVLANPYVVLAAILAGVMWPAWVTTGLLVAGGDVLLIHYPWFVLWRDLLAAGEFPFWNPYSFSGLPAFATLQAGYGYPPHWLLTPLPPIVAINWLIGLHVVLAGLGTAWTCGRLGVGRAGQILAGLSYALGSAMVARLWAGHLSFLEANAWLPLATGLAFDIRGRRRVVLLALVVALMMLAGQPEIVIFCLWWLPLWAGLAAMRAEWRTLGLALARTVLAVGLGGALAAFQMLPVLEVLAISNRQVRMEWDFRTAASLPPWHLFELLGPLVFGDPRTSGYWPGPPYEWHERLLYVGIVPLLAAGFAGGRWRWLCYIAAGVAVALSFGGYAPWYHLAELLPGYSSLRIPSKHLVLAALALALAAGVGFERLRGPRSAVVAIVVAAAVAVLGSTMSFWVPVLGWLGGGELITAPARRALANPPIPVLLVTAGILVLAAGAISLPSSTARRLALVALALLDLVLVLQPFRLRPVDPASVVADAGPSLQRYQRAALIGDGATALANYGPVLRVQQPVGYVSLFSGEYMTLLTGRSNAKVEIELQRDAVPFLSLLGYEAVIERRGGRETVLPLTSPRAWVARCAWPGGALQVRERDFPRQACVTRVAAPTREQPVEPAPARIVSEGAGWLTIDAEGPGWLVTTRPWYPGWSAEAAGRVLSVEPVDGALVGVSLPAGRQTVTLRYWPAGLTRGLAISAVAALILLGLWWLGRSSQGKGARWHSLASS